MSEGSEKIAVSAELVRRAARALVMVADERLTDAWLEGYPASVASLDAYPEEEQREWEELAHRVLEFAINERVSLKCPHGDRDVDASSPEEAFETMVAHVKLAHPPPEEDRQCSGCGCTGGNACVTLDGPCSWIAGETRCSGCLYPEARLRGPVPTLRPKDAPAASTAGESQILLS